MRRRGEKAELPVICIGNFTVGGAGKTPTALAVARMLDAAGESPAFLSRGYGGRLRGPVQVRLKHTASDVGDEPILLSQTGPDHRLPRPPGRSPARLRDGRDRRHHG